MNSTVVLGAGRIGRSIAQGLRGYLGSGAPLFLVQRNPAKAAVLRADGYEVAANIRELPLGRFPTVVLAVNPDDVPTALHEIETSAPDGALVASVAAKWRLADLTRALPATFECRRFRTNVLASMNQGTVLMLDGEGVAAPRAAPRAATATRRFVELCESLGQCFSVPDEPTLDSITWFSSTLPIVLLSKLALACSEHLSHSERALTLRLLGSGCEGMVHALRDITEEHVDVGARVGALVDSVVTPGGSNDTALEYLECAGVFQAVAAAFSRYRSVGDQAPGTGKTA